MTGPGTPPPAPEPPGRERVIHLAGDALRSAIREDHQAAAAAVQAISDEAGGPGVELAVHAWADTLIAAYRQATGTADTAPVQPGWINAGTGDIAADADGVPGEVRWAGRFIAARAAMDHPACYALLTALPDDGAAIGAHVLALLNMTALTLRTLTGSQS